MNMKRGVQFAPPWRWRKGSDMKTYRVDCLWQMTGTYTFEAAAEEEAVEKANAAPLPDDSSYLDGSFEIVCVEEVKPCPA